MQLLTFILALVVVLALFGAGALLFRRFAGSRLGNNTNRGRMPRLALIDATALDARRRLVLVRRDNVEHLLMIGGPTDIVVEPNIVRAMPARDQTQPRAAVGTELPPRVAPLPDAGNWADHESARAEAFDFNEPAMPEPPPRPVRKSFAEETRFTDEPRRPAPLPSERRSDPIMSFTPEPLGGRPEPRPELRGEPMPSRVTSRNEPVMPRAPRPAEAPKAPPIRAAERPTAPPPIPAPTQSAQPLSAADQNLAEMAQRLEAALRRPGGDTGEPRIGAPPVAPEPPAGRLPQRTEPQMAPPVAAPSPKSGFENLEDEMASLLGRPKTPS